MKALILSDIHGSALAASKALSYFEKFGCQKIFLLGDVLYHGPRNPLPDKYGPMGVVEAFSHFEESIVAVRGNCDADVDLMVLGFPFRDDYALVEDAGKTLFLSHGHLYNPEYLPKKADAYLYGHTHILDLHTNSQGVLLMNPGSTSLPKGGNPPTFGLYDSDSGKARFSIHRLDNGKEIAGQVL